MNEVFSETQLGLRKGYVRTVNPIFILKKVIQVLTERKQKGNGSGLKNGV